MDSSEFTVQRFSLGFSAHYLELGYASFVLSFPRILLHIHTLLHHSLYSDMPKHSPMMFLDVDAMIWDSRIEHGC